MTVGHPIVPTSIYLRQNNPIWTINYVGTLFVCGFSKSLLLDSHMDCEFLGSFSMLSISNLFNPRFFPP